MEINDDSTLGLPSSLGKSRNPKDFYFYQKSDVIYQLSFAFCDRFIHLYKDRTRDQVIQAARSCKQNIVEGIDDGLTSTELQLKLINVARSSLSELREDYEDYIKSRHLKLWDSKDSRYDPMLQYCRTHNQLEDYAPFFTQWNDEEMCNYALTLCHMVDKMLKTFLRQLDQEFVTEGGIKERMYRARTGYRNQQDERLKQLEAERPQLEQQIAALTAQLAQTQQQLASALAANAQWQAAYDDLKQRALKAYNAQRDEIASLKKRLGE